MEENKTNYTVLEDPSHSDSPLNENDINLQNVHHRYLYLQLTVYRREGPSFRF